MPTTYAKWPFILWRRKVGDQIVTMFLARSRRRRRKDISKKKNRDWNPFFPMISSKPVYSTSPILKIILPQDRLRNIAQNHWQHLDIKNLKNPKISKNLEVLYVKRPQKLHLEIFRFFQTNPPLVDPPALDSFNFCTIMAPKMCTKITICGVHNVLFLEWTNLRRLEFYFLECV